MSLLKPSTQTQAYAKVGILGFGGAGKTWTAGLIATGLCKMIGAKQIAFFDTETGSDWLAEMFTEAGVEALVLKSRSFDDLVKGLDEAKTAKIQVGIIDSVTHYWRELVSTYDAKLHRNGRMQFQDWAIVKREWAEYTDRYVNLPMHLIACGRAGYSYDYDYNEDGTKDLVTTGTKMKAEGEFGFEPSLCLEMERVDPQKDRALALNKKEKQMFRPKAGSQWIHRCHVLKDRADRLDGAVFDDPTFENFLPHFERINIGGVHLGVDTTRTSAGRFNIEGKPRWKEREDAKAVAIEELAGEVGLAFPGSTANEKRAKLKLYTFIFGSASLKALELKGPEELQSGVLRFRVILADPFNVQRLLEGSDPIESVDTPPSPLMEIDTASQHEQDMEYVMRAIELSGTTVAAVEALVGGKHIEDLSHDELRDLYDRLNSEEGLGAQKGAV